MRKRLTADEKFAADEAFVESILAMPEDDDELSDDEQVLDDCEICG